MNVKKTGKPALIEAAKGGYDECVDLLLSSGASVNLRNKFGNTALIAAVKSGNDRCVNKLIQAGADVNASVSGIAPLHIAADNGDPCVESLIQGADINVPNYLGTTALMFTVRNENNNRGHYVNLCWMQELM